MLCHRELAGQRSGAEHRRPPVAQARLLTFSVVRQRLSGAFGARNHPATASPSLSGRPRPHIQAIWTADSRTSATFSPNSTINTVAGQALLSRREHRGAAANSSAVFAYHENNTHKFGGLNRRIECENSVLITTEFARPIAGGSRRPDRPSCSRSSGRAARASRSAGCRRPP